MDYGFFHKNECNSILLGEKGSHSNRFIGLILKLLNNIGTLTLGLTSQNVNITISHLETKYNKHNVTDHVKSFKNELFFGISNHHHRWKLLTIMFVIKVMFKVVSPNI